MRKSFVVGLGLVVGLALSGCHDPVGTGVGDTPNFGNGNGNGNGGGNPGGGSDPVPGIEIVDGVGGLMMGDGLDYTALPSTTGSSRYKKDVCNVVVNYDFVGDTTKAFYHEPFKAPKRARGECQVGGVLRQIFFDFPNQGVRNVVSMQANWLTAAVPDVNDSWGATGKINAYCSPLRFKPSLGADSLMVTRIDERTLRVSTQPYPNNKGYCDDTNDPIVPEFGQLIYVDFEYFVLEDTDAAGW